MKKALTYLLVILDIFAFAAFTSFASCFGKTDQTCTNAIGSPVTWFAIILAVISTGFYMYKRSKGGLPLLPFSPNLLEKPNIPWIYGLYYFLALIFWGENLPEIAGYLKGLPLGAPGTHASLMNPALFFTGNSGTALNLLGFAAISLAVTALFKKLNFLLAFIGSNAIGTTIEYVTKLGRPPEVPEGFDIYNNLWGTILNFILLWSLIILGPYIVFKGVSKVWGSKGIVVLIGVMLFLNIGFYFFSKYEMEVLKNVQPGYLGGARDVLPKNICPDQIVLDNGKPFAYKDGKALSIEGNTQFDWIKTNCPNVKR